MAYKSGRCWACHKQRPVEMHHTSPVAYGGEENGEKVPICADCHNILHKEAEHYYKHGKFQELDHTIPYIKDGYGHRLRILIAKVVKTKQMFKAGELDAGEQRRMTAISWDSDEELLMAHSVKLSLGFKSLERAIKKLVFDTYHKLQE